MASSNLIKRGYSSVERSARVLAYRLAQKANREKLGYPGYHIPVELSLVQNCFEETPDGREAETTYTFRFEGGTVVRLTLEGHLDDGFGMFFWAPIRATVQYYKHGAQPGPHMPKSVLLLSEESLHNLAKALPESEDEKMAQMLAEKGFQSLNELEYLIVRATYGRKEPPIGILSVSYAHYGPSERVYFRNFGHDQDGRPQTDVVVRLEEAEFEKFRKELVAEDEAAIVEFLNSKKLRKLENPKEGWVERKDLEDAINDLMAHSCYRTQFEFIGIPDSQPWARIDKVDGLIARKITINLPDDVYVR